MDESTNKVIHLKQKQTTAVMAGFALVAMSIGLFITIFVSQISNITNNQSQAFLPVSFCAPNPCSEGFSCAELIGGKCYISDIQNMSAYTDYELFSSRISEVLAGCDPENPGNLSSSSCDESSKEQLSLLQDDLDQLEAIVLFQVNETKKTYDAAKKIISQCQSNPVECDNDTLESAERAVNTIDLTVKNANRGNFVSEILLSTFADVLENN